MDAADATPILGDDMRAAAESLTRIDEMLSAVFSDDTSRANGITRIYSHLKTTWLEWPVLQARSLVF